MKLTAARVVGDALQLFRRDRQALTVVAGVFWFLPAYAIALLVPEPPRLVETATPQANAELLAPWLTAYGSWYLLDFALALWGAATVYRLYCAPERPAVGAAMRDAPMLWLRLLLASALAAMALLPLALLLSALPAGFGVVPWTLATLWVLGRLMPVGPALAAERPLSALGALRRAWALTRGAGAPLAGLAAAVLGLGWLIQQPFALLAAWVVAEGANPVAVALVDAGSAAVAAAAALASALLAVVAYRLLASKGM